MVSLSACSPKTPEAMEKKDGEVMMEKGENDVMKKEGDVMEKKEEHREVIEEEGSMMEDNSVLKNMKMTDVFADAVSIDLKDVAKSGATGKAWLVFKDGKTYHRVTSPNLPALTNDDFYEGWIVKGLFSIVSSGKMEFDSARNEWILDYVTDGDKTDHKTIVITQEPNDGDPAPAKHIIEGKF